jgi:foldase protein PrsA
VLTTACNGSTKPSAATVNRDHVDRAELLAEIEALSKVPGLTSQQRFVKSDSGNFAAAEVANYLDGRIVDTIVAQQVKANNVTVSDTNKADAAKELPQQLGAQSLDGLDPKVQQTLTDRLAATVAMIAWLGGSNNTPRTWWTDADVKTFFDKTLSDTEQACTRHILVKTQAEADAIVTQLKGGADFATLAKAQSIDTGSKDAGGDLGCNPKGAFIEEFEAAIAGAKAGDIVGPVQTKFGFHVINVISPYAKPTFDDAAKASIAKQFATPSGWLSFQFATAKITVDPRFGTWDAQKGATTPPVGSASPSTVAPTDTTPAPSPPTTAAK